MSKRIIKLISVITVAAFVMSLGVLAFAEEFNDISGHWAEQNVIKWSDRGVIKGYDGAFHPDDNIIRGDMAVIINRVMNYPEKSVNLFFDLRDGEYYTDAVLCLNKAGIMLGDANYVRPDDNITREEAFVMFGRVYNIKGESGNIDFADKSEISDWANEIICGMVKSGIVNGSGDNKIHPKDFITRAEVITILNNIEENLINTGEKSDSVKPSDDKKDDVTPTPQKNNGNTETDKRNEFEIDFGEGDAVEFGSGTSGHYSGHGGSSSDGDEGGEYGGSSEVIEAVIGAEDTEVGTLW